jgi:hypothetical protein
MVRVSLASVSGVWLLTLWLFFLLTFSFLFPSFDCSFLGFLLLHDLLSLFISHFGDISGRLFLNFGLGFSHLLLSFGVGFFLLLALLLLDGGLNLLVVPEDFDVLRDGSVDCLVALLLSGEEVSFSPEEAKEGIHKAIKTSIVVTNSHDRVVVLGAIGEVFVVGFAGHLVCFC